VQHLQVTQSRLKESAANEVIDGLKVFLTLPLYFKTVTVLNILKLTNSPNLHNSVSHVLCLDYLIIRPYHKIDLSCFHFTVDHSRPLYKVTFIIHVNQGKLGTVQAKMR